MDAVAGAFAEALLTAYGVPSAAVAVIGYFLWKNRSQTPPGAVPQDIHVQMQGMRDMLVKILAILEERKND